MSSRQSLGILTWKVNQICRSWKGQGSLSPVSTSQVPSKEKEQMNPQVYAHCISAHKTNSIFVWLSRSWILLKNINNRNITSFQLLLNPFVSFLPTPVAWGSGRIILLFILLTSCNFIFLSSTDFKAYWNEYKYICYIRAVKLQFISSPTLSVLVVYISNEPFNKASFYIVEKQSGL